MNTKPKHETASASQNRAIAKNAAETGLATLRPEDMPTKAQRRKWAKEYREAQDGALKLVGAINTLPATDAPEAPLTTEHDCPKCGEHFSTCICEETNAPQAQHSPLMLCANVKYQDGDTLSIKSVQSKPRETICLLLKYKANADQRFAVANKLAEALREIEHLLDCGNRDESHVDDALGAARAALAEWEAGQCATRNLARPATVPAGSSRKRVVNRKTGSICSCA